MSQLLTLTKAQAQLLESLIHKGTQGGIWPHECQYLAVMLEIPLYPGVTENSYVWRGPPKIAKKHMAKPRRKGNIMPFPIRSAQDVGWVSVLA